MNISSLSPSLTILPTTSSTLPSAPSDSTDAVGEAAKSSVSPAGSIFDQLKSLEQSDPAKFKQVMSDMASALRDDAKQAGGADAAQLSKLADRFDEAAQTGQLSAASPSAQASKPHHHHGHHGGAGASAIGAALQSAFAAALSGSTDAPPTTGADASAAAVRPSAT